MNSNTPSSRRIPVIAFACALTLTTSGLAGCSQSPATASAGGTDATAAATPAPAGAAPAATNATTLPATGLAARTGELINPDNPTMVFLYHDLAGIAPPIDQWVERDSRVNQAPGADKAAVRKTVKAELDAGMASVRGVGVLHLTLRADLRAYDPTYGEFTLAALAPGSAYGFEALGEKVALTFDNGLVAQTWSVPGEQAQTIVDKFGNAPLNLDATLKIRKVLPGPGGGTLVAHVVSWNLRDANSGNTIAKVQVPER